MSKLRIGLWAALAENSGLGNQTLEFYRHMKPVKTVVYDRQVQNGRDIFLDRYDGPGVTVETSLNIQVIQEFVKDLDIIYVAETPYDYRLFTEARKAGAKTVLHFNPEFLDYMQKGSLVRWGETDSLMPKFLFPDLLLAPSSWYYDKVKDMLSSYARFEMLPFPVDTDRFCREIVDRSGKAGLTGPAVKDKVKTVLHIAGHELYEDRNGTQAVLEMLRSDYCPPLDFVIYAQDPLELGSLPENVDVRQLDVENYWELYREGDILLLPRRYGGQSLQLNEACANCMIPLMPKVSPQKDFLPDDMLFPAPFRKQIQTRFEIDCYEIDPKMMALRLQDMAEMTAEQVQELSAVAKMYADVISWDNMKPKYDQLFRSLL